MVAAFASQIKILLTTTSAEDNPSLSTSLQLLRTSLFTTTTPSHVRISRYGNTYTTYRSQDIEIDC